MPNHLAFCRECGRALCVRYLDHLTDRQFACGRCRQKARPHATERTEYPPRTPRAGGATGARSSLQTPSKVGSRASSPLANRSPNPPRNAACHLVASSLPADPPLPSVPVPRNQHSPSYSACSINLRFSKMIKNSETDPRYSREAPGPTRGAGGGHTPAEGDPTRSDIQSIEHLHLTLAISA